MAVTAESSSYRNVTVPQSPVLAVASFHEPLPLTKLGATHERRPVRGQD